MIRAAIVLGCVCALASPGTAMVGGAPPTSEGAGRAVVMLTGSRGTFCSGVALGRDLVLTAAHCVLPGANYKLVEFDGARQPALKDLTVIARHPDFDVNASGHHARPLGAGAKEPLAPPHHPRGVKRIAGDEEL